MANATTSGDDTTFPGSGEIGATTGTESSLSNYGVNTSLI